MTSLRILGTLDLRDPDGEEILAILSRPPRVAVLSYLALQGRGQYVNRDLLMGLFWPESDESHARNALNQLLYHLRRALGDDALRTRGRQDVGLESDGFGCDVWAYRDALDAGDHEEALQLYRGELLPGFHLSGCDAFERWLEGERGRLRESAAGAAWAVAHGHLARQELVEAERTAQHALDLVLTDESEVRRFIAALAEAGDRAAAVNFYHKFSGLLRHELDLEPSAETTAVAQEIRRADSAASHGPRELRVGDSIASETASADRLVTIPPSVDGSNAEGVHVGGPRAPAKRRTSRRATVVLGALAVVAIALLGVRQLIIGFVDPGPPPEDRPYTVLAAVRGSADSAMRETVEYWIRTELDNAQVVQTVPATEVERLLTLMERSPTESLEPRVARALAERAGVSTVVLPRLDVAGAGFIVAVRVEEVAGGHLRAEATRRAANEEVLLEAVSDATRELRRELGESRAALANTAPLPDVLTHSLEALRKFREGREAHDAMRFEAAAALYREALAIDPEFAEARQYLGSMYLNRGFRDSGLVEYRRALETPERLRGFRRRDTEATLMLSTDFALWDERLFRTGHTFNEPLRLFLFGYVDSAVTLRMSRLLNEVLPRRFDPERRLDAGNIAWSMAIWTAIHGDRLRELEALRDSLRVDPTPWWDFKVSVGMAEWDRADSLLDVDPSLPRSSTYHAWLDAARGRVRSSHEHEPYSLGVELVYGVPGTDTVRALTGRGFWEVWAYAEHGLRAALAGDSIEMKRVLARFQAARDSATSALFEHAYEPLFALLEAELAMHRGDWPAAAERLAPSVRKLGQPGYGLSNWWDEHLRWVLADVYTRLGHPDSAIAELEAIVERPPRWAYSAAQFRLGQLYSQVGNREEALDHYTTFLDAFTDPDPEYVWMVEEAREELDRLARER